MTKSLSLKRTIVYLFAFWILTLFGIAMAIREYDIIGVLEKGIEVPDSILIWNDILPLVLLVSSLILFLILMYSFGKIIEVMRRGIRTLGKSKKKDDSNNLEEIVNSISSSLFGSIKSSLIEQSRNGFTYLLAILICLFNPLTRILISAIYPAENLFHYLQQIRISLIFQLTQLFWITILCGLLYLHLKSQKENR